MQQLLGKIKLNKQIWSIQPFAKTVITPSRVSIVIVAARLQILLI
ncbi:hypothetical protein AQPE_3956 [Aquipluma nitroreducens]|uniref:Uncharacterized protein n=1 Tax=Aquipluma nitroreducens TaxID=2010828 RepID=A0A5K7SDX0_9BACT|nr:hypothetical protein AQPE_3956 [Aquipluma nitroreducens]